MTTVFVNGQPTPVTFSPGVLTDTVTAPTILAFPPFQDYCERFDARFIVQGIEIQAVTMFGTRVGFMFVNARITDIEGRRIPGAAFLRGGSVVILVVLSYGDRQFTVVTRQPRSPVGQFDLLGLPAGMLDGDGNFVGKAAQELKEELGIDVAEDDLIDLNRYDASLIARSGPDRHIPVIYASPGGSDEFYRFFLLERMLTKPQLDAMQGRRTGNVDEDERITLEVMPLEDLVYHATSASTLAALQLYELFMKDRSVDLYVF